MHIIHELDVSAFQSKKLQWVIKGISRSKSHLVKQALPITPSLLAEMLQKLGNTHNDLVLKALFSVAFFLLCRKSNLVPNSSKVFDKSKQLTRGDFQVCKRVLLVKIKWSKTIQFSQKTHTVPIVAIPKSRICPVRHYRNMIRALPGSPHDPAFFWYQGKSKTPVTYKDWALHQRSLIAKTGRDHTKFSSHSFRRGGASFAFKVGIPAETIKLLGDWQSDAFLRYIQIPMEKKVEAAVKISKKLGSCK
jgi:hypothetical protein